MFTKLWQKITGHRRQHPHQSLRAAAREIGVPKSTMHDHDKRLEKRNLYTESVFWESSAGQDFLKRILVSSIYTVSIKGGVGAGRIEDFFEHLRLEQHMGVSRSSIQRMIKEIEYSILRYKELIDKERNSFDHSITGAATSKEQLEYLEVVLGVDETWLNQMLLVCQDLSSGFLFLNKPVPKEIPNTGTKPSNQSPKNIT